MSNVYIRFAARGSGHWAREPLLERCLRHASAPLAVADWRAAAFRTLAGAEAASTPAPAPAAALLAASASAAMGATDARWVCLATPLHAVAGMTDVALAADGVLRLEPPEAAALAADFGRVFGSAGMRLVVRAAAHLLLVFDRVLEVTTHDPEDALGGDLYGLQPRGLDAGTLRTLMSEMEMWLFEHPVNQARTARAALRITGLWLWGGGAPLPGLPNVAGWTAGGDVSFAAYRAVTEYPRGRAGADAGASAGVLVCAATPGTPAWAEIEARWLVPALAALRAGHLEQLLFSTADRCVTVGRPRALRLWRRVRPWWESFGLEGSESNGVQ